MLTSGKVMMICLFRLSKRGNGRAGSVVVVVSGSLLEALEAL